MTEKLQESNDFNSVNLIAFLWNRRLILIIVSLVAAIASAVFSGPFFITPKFKSTVVLFPSSTNSISKSLLSQTSGAKQDILQFGEEEEAEQLLQILNSNDIRARIIQKYDLMNHYEIDSTGKFKITNLFKEYRTNINFRRTEYMAVEISVLDKDPVIAANIANDISDLLDTTKIKMQKTRAIKGFHVVEAEYLQLLNEIKIKEDSLAVLRKLGINDYESQAEMINMQLAMEIAKNPNSAAVKALEAKLDILAQYGTPYVSIRDQLEYDKKQLTEIKGKYNEAKVDAEEELPQTFVVDKAFPAEKKSYPIRWLIVVVSVFAALILSIITIIFVENISKIRLKDKLS
ncbi:MAG: hypothetical protein K9J13_03385 [Saprospiraceae bacterium]|nr:hypothetical protein [Saprospiraceae bacterium]